MGDQPVNTLRCVLLLVLVGCGRSTIDTDPPAPASFPHPANYQASHGKDAGVPGAGCESCHSATGDVPSAGPACSECHPAYPHNDTVAQGSVHGPPWASEPAQCTNCHGTLGTKHPTGHRPSACTDCHSTYPHQEGWSSPSGHGQAVRDQGSPTACLSCHTKDAATDCASCHATYPHPEGWADKRAHGAAYKADTTSCGSRCHSHTEPTDTPSCNRCHQGYPHTDTWTPTGHATAVQNQGVFACQSCHSKGYPKGPWLPVSCSDGCHTVVP